MEKLFKITHFFRTSKRRKDYPLRVFWMGQERRIVKNASREAVNREFKDLAERKIRRIPRGAWRIFLT